MDRARRGDQIAVPQNALAATRRRSDQREFAKRARRDAEATRKPCRAEAGSKDLRIARPVDGAGLKLENRGKLRDFLQVRATAERNAENKAKKKKEERKKERRGKGCPFCHGTPFKERVISC